MLIKENIAISSSGYVFNPQTGESFTLNPMCVKVLDMLKKEYKIESIVEALEQEYNIPNLNLRCDLEDFFNMLKQYSLLCEDAKI